MIRLELPSSEYCDSFFEACAEYAAEGSKEALACRDRSDFADYLARLDRESKGIGLPEGFVPATMYWIIDADGYAGRIMLRHHLTSSLERFGGHVGYIVRPTKRGRGYATEALRLILIEAQKLGLDRLLLTCDRINTASARVIEKNRGKRDPEWDAEGDVLRYWIEVI